MELELRDLSRNKKNSRIDQVYFTLGKLFLELAFYTERPMCVTWRTHGVHMAHTVKECDWFTFILSYRKCGACAAAFRL